jgi:hypothetical protein
MDIKNYQQHNKSSNKTLENREVLYELFNETPIPTEQLLVNLGLYMRSSCLGKILFLNEFYEKIKNIPGDILVFGAWWGQDVVTLYNLRAVHEPYNYTRKIIAFDSFEGYKSISKKDIVSETIKKGGYTVSEDYEDYIEKLLNYHETENILPHLKKYKIIKGDIVETVKEYLNDNPETIIAGAYFDLAIYEPTKIALESIEPYLLNDSVLALDQLNAKEYPGETIAFREFFKNKKYSIERSTFLPDRTFINIK